MTPQDINRLLTTQPFEPFRIYLSDGRTFDVHHPDFVMVGHRTAHIYEVDDPSIRVFSTYAIISLLHITRVEPLETAAPH